MCVWRIRMRNMNASMRVTEHLDINMTHSQLMDKYECTWQEVLRRVMILWIVWVLVWSEEHDNVFSSILCCSVLQCVAVCCSVLQCVAGVFVSSACVHARAQMNMHVSTYGYIHMHIHVNMQTYMHVYEYEDIPTFCWCQLSYTDKKVHLRLETLTVHHCLR